MGIATKHSLLEGNTGKVGAIVMRTLNNRTIISRASKGRSKKSDLEKENHGLFQQASAYAKLATRDPGLKAYFASIAETSKYSNAYTAALSFKLKELKASAKEELKKASATTSSIQEGLPAQQGLSNDVHSNNNFPRICEDICNVFEESLSKLSTAWGNLERLELNEQQHEVLRALVRAQIRETFNRL